MILLDACVYWRQDIKTTDVFLSDYLERYEAKRTIPEQAKPYQSLCVKKSYAIPLNISMCIDT